MITCLMNSNPRMLNDSHIYVMHATFTAHRFLFTRIRKISKKRLLVSSCPSDRPHGKNSAAAGQSFVKLDIWVFFENVSRKFEFN